MPSPSPPLPHNRLLLEPFLKHLGLQSDVGTLYRVALSRCSFIHPTIHCVSRFGIITLLFGQWNLYCLTDPQPASRGHHSEPVILGRLGRFDNTLHLQEAERSQRATWRARSPRSSPHEDPTQAAVPTPGTGLAGARVAPPICVFHQPWPIQVPWAVGLWRVSIAY